MKTTHHKVLLALAVFLAAVTVPFASAGCANPLGRGHLSNQSWDGQSGGPSLLLVNNDATMVGMWHVLFIAQGNGPDLPPDGAQVDNALSQWHDDGTEVTLSSRAPDTGDVCLGVWKRVGQRHYKLNHYGIAFDPSTDPNNPLGFANIRQDIWLASDGQAFKGMFSIDQYDTSGNLLVEIKGVLHGTRVTMHTSTSDLLSQN